MKTFRIGAGILASLPLTLLVDSIFLHPDNYEAHSLGNLLYLVLGVPILTLNCWAWTCPEIIEFYFFGVENSPNSGLAHEGFFLYAWMIERGFTLPRKPL